MHDVNSGTRLGTAAGVAPAGRALAAIALAVVALTIEAGESRLCAAPATASTRVVLGPRPVGSRAVETYRFALRATMSTVAPPAAPERRPVVQELSYRRETRVLAVRRGAVTRLEVRYLDAQEKTSDEGQITTSTPPVKGRTYVLSVRGGKLVAQRGGKNVTGAELSFLRAQHPELGRVPVLATLLRQRTRRKPYIEPTGAQLAPLMGVPALRVLAQPLTVKRASFLPKDGNGRVVNGELTFAASVTYGRPGGGGGSMGFGGLRGELTVRADGGWPLRLQLSGTVSASATDEGQMVSVDGKVQVSRSISYR